MDNQKIDNSFSNNGASLQLRSREVSEVMGKIPGWIGTWGTLVICLCFTLSILFIVNIKSTQRINGKAILLSQETGVTAGLKKSYLLKVSVSRSEYDKIDKSQELSFLSAQAEHPLNGLNHLKFLIRSVKTGADSCEMYVSVNQHYLEEIERRDRVITNSYVRCFLLANISVFKKMSIL